MKSISVSSIWEVIGAVETQLAFLRAHGFISNHEEKVILSSLYGKLEPLFTEWCKGDGGCYEDHGGYSIRSNGGELFVRVPLATKVGAVDIVTMLRSTGQVVMGPPEDLIERKKRFLDDFSMEDVAWRIAEQLLRTDSQTECWNLYELSDYVSPLLQELQQNGETGWKVWYEVDTYRYLRLVRRGWSIHCEVKQGVRDDEREPVIWTAAKVELC